MTTTRSAAIPSERFTALVGLLNREATLVERLVFKLTEVELLSTAGESRFMGLMVDEVDTVASELGAVEVARAVLVADLAHALGLEPDDVPLGELIPYAPAEVAGTLGDLKDRLTDLATELEAVTLRGNETLGDRLTELRSTLERAERSSFGQSGYDRYGNSRVSDLVPRQVDHTA